MELSLDDTGASLTVPSALFAALCPPLRSGGLQTACFRVDLRQQAHKHSINIERKQYFSGGGCKNGQG
jgi:hypothetical protein